jgi:hypothetical protein
MVHGHILVVSLGTSQPDAVAGHHQRSPRR